VSDPSSPPRYAGRFILAFASHLARFPESEEFGNYRAQWETEENRPTDSRSQPVPIKESPLAAKYYYRFLAYHTSDYVSSEEYLALEQRLSTLAVPDMGWGIMAELGPHWEKFVDTEYNQVLLDRVRQWGVKPQLELTPEFITTLVDFSEGFRSSPEGEHYQEALRDSTTAVAFYRWFAAYFIRLPVSTEFAALETAMAGTAAGKMESTYFTQLAAYMARFQESAAYQQLLEEVAQSEGRQYVEMASQLNGDGRQQGEYYQMLARYLGVDVVVEGAVTEYLPYTPPRLGLSVNWWAANPGFHPIPAGYGLPWGTAREEYIPEALVREAEFALAREQLETQTPAQPAVGLGVAGGEQVQAEMTAKKEMAEQNIVPGLPDDWPDPLGFLPPPPNSTRPEYLPQYRPIIEHTALYRGDDADFTERLANYFYYRDDSRFGGWQAYLQRPEDFTNFCCYLHITEMLAARGGADETRVVWRWPFSRYER